MKTRYHSTTPTLPTALAALAASFLQPLKAADYTAELAAVEALGGLTTAPLIHTADTSPGIPATLAAGDLKTIYFYALDYLGNPTRVFFPGRHPGDSSDSRSRRSISAGPNRQFGLSRSISFHTFQ